jgi:hypothetical protein
VSVKREIVIVVSIGEQVTRCTKDKWTSWADSSLACPLFYTSLVSLGGFFFNLIVQVIYIIILVS